MSITLELSPEAEARLQNEAASRGLHAPEYAQRLIEALLQPEATTDSTERERLGAVDELLGMGIGAGFSTADLHQQRQEESEREEEQYQRMFKGKRAA